MNLRQVLKVSLLFFSFVLIQLATHAQLDEEDLIQQRIEFISEQTENSELDLTSQYDYFAVLLDNPLNLNRVEKWELQQMNILTDQQIDELFLHIEAFGNLVSIYELQTLSTWDKRVIDLILPFVSILSSDVDDLNPRLLLRQGKFEWISRMRTVLNDQVGYEWINGGAPLYFGPKFAQMHRFKYTYRNQLSIGITAENDAGESMLSSNNKLGADFYSVHGFYRGKKWVRAIALGDYQLELGQGLICWTGMSLSKSAEPFTIKRAASGIRPYTGADENRFLRGVAADLKWRNWSFLPFISYCKRDATLDTANGEVLVRSFYTSGLHRTPAEIAKKDMILEFLSGFRLKYESRSFHVGFQSIRAHYSDTLTPNSTAYNQFAFRGKNAAHGSIDFSYGIKNALFFGEYALDMKQRALAGVGGIMLVPDKRVNFSVLYRNYTPSYNAYYAASFSNFSDVQNEQGLYVGFRGTITPTSILSVYHDLFYSKWLRYKAYAPAAGGDLLIMIQKRFSKKSDIYLRFRQKRVQQNSLVETSMDELEWVTTTNLRLHLNYELSKGIELRSRCEWVSVKRLSDSNQTGIQLMQELVFQMQPLKTQVVLRYALREVSSYDARIYAFERNPLYMYAVDVAYGNGSRAYVYVQTKLTKQITCWVKYGKTLYTDRNEIGSGGDLIQGNRKDDLFVQIRVNI